MTDQSGRALLVAPLNPGVIFAAIEGRRGRVPTTIVAPTETELTLVDVNSVPRIASLSDRFDILGHGFCGDADANNVNIGGLPAIVLASSATFSLFCRQSTWNRGLRPVKISCGKNSFNFQHDFSAVGAARRFFRTRARGTSRADRQRARHAG